MAAASAGKESFDFDACVEAAAKNLHNAQRAPRLLPEGGFVPWMKPDGLGGHVDIANTEYENLPPLWQTDNRAAAVSAVTDVLRTPNADVELLAAAVHAAWLTRNAGRALGEHLGMYEDLSESEKQKDRAVVVAALAAVNCYEQPPA